MEELSWWDALSGYERIYWTITIPATLLLVILMIATFLGADADDMGSADSEVGADDGIGFQFFTFKNVVGFFTVFGWTGLACLDAGMSYFTSLIVSTFCGLLMMAAMAALFYFIMKLAESGTLNLKNAIGSVGEVYLPIEKNRSGFGKVQVNVQGQLRTLQALTDEDEDLKVGSVVTVVSVVGENILLVQK